MAEQRKRIKHKAIFEEKLAEERPRDSNWAAEERPPGSTRVAVALAAPMAAVGSTCRFPRQQAISTPRWGAPSLSRRNIIGNDSRDSALGIDCCSLPRGKGNLT